MPCRRGTPGRKAGGNMLILIGVITLATAAVILILLFVPSLLLVHNNMNSVADKVGLEAAIMLNKGNRIGEMNDMTAHSRELVFTWRQTYDTVSHGYNHLQPLASLLMEESRKGARLVEDERKFLSAQLADELRGALGQESKKAEQAGATNLVFFELKKNGIDRIELGYVSDIPSNAVSSSGVPELKQFDKNQSLLLAGTDYFRGNISAPLPSPDQDLKFEFSSLPPMIKQTVSQARLISSNDFVKQFEIGIKESSHGSKKHDVQTFCLPSAVRVVSSVSAGPKKLNQNISLSSIATTAGSQRVE